MTSDYLWLSPPHVTDIERDLLLAAFDSNWISPVGPDLAAFEDALSETLGRPHAVALSSGTAALHLGLQLVGVAPGDTVVVPSFTFVATANAVGYTDALPVFIDSEPGSWNINPDLLEENLAAWSKQGRLPAAVVAVDLYGCPADYTRLEPICAEYDVPLIVDAAESVGATHAGRPAASYGRISGVSFNGNKIMTTSGGGALLCDDQATADRARHLATQAREPAPHYEHIEAGYNYRLSNLLAALGRGQLRRLPDMMGRRREIHARYTQAMADWPGIRFQPDGNANEPNRWLTVMTVDPAEAGGDREQIRLALDAVAIEARPAWKPLHMQPLFADAEMIGGSVCEAVFADGLCLPSGSAMTDEDVDRVVRVVAHVLGHS